MKLPNNWETYSRISGTHMGWKQMIIVIRCSGFNERSLLRFDVSKLMMMRAVARRSRSVAV